MSYCPYCGTQLSSDMRYCPSCGAAVGNLETVYEVTETASAGTGNYKIFIGFSRPSGTIFLPDKKKKKPNCHTLNYGLFPFLPTDGMAEFEHDEVLFGHITVENDLSYHAHTGSGQSLAQWSMMALAYSNPTSQVFFPFVPS